MSTSLKTLPGRSYPLGATLVDKGVNFSLFTKNATAVELLLFDREDHSKPTHIIQLDSIINKTFYYWHILIPGLKEGQLYGYRVYGPFEPAKGKRFDGNKVLVDPYARAVVTETYSREKASKPGDNCAEAIKSVVIDPQNYDWEGDQPLRFPFAKSVIYELHVGGFTKHPNSGVANEMKGTYRGLIEKIPYLKKLGITSVELMPVQQFDLFDLPNPKLTNYWGYSPIAFFAPHNGYSSTTDPVATVNEFRDMVKALHRAGIEVILDVVFNHSAEGNHQGPTLSFRGLENLAYYMLENQKDYYRNFSGTGNTLNANHSVVRRMILDCLKHWVEEMHVDGFRFDLAAVLSRDESGKPIENPPILWSIESEPCLAPTKIIAEAWDLGHYQLGSFVGDKWAEWNGRFRDDIRKFIKGDPGLSWTFSKRILGSPDIFRPILRNPNRSINFITAHDGFTMNDLVSYNQKHNLANGEDNRDGHNENHSWNHGTEGLANDPEIEALRQRQIKNMLTILMISKGTPMLLMGDEVRRTQKGNNNAYCQDNELSWFDWELPNRHKDLLTFVQKLIQFNLKTEFFQESYYWSDQEDDEDTQITFHGTKLFQPDWSEHSHSLAFTLYNAQYKKSLHIMVNAYWESLEFELPKNGIKKWKRLIDTSLNSPDDFYTPKNASVVKNKKYRLAPRSLVLLYSKT